MTQATIINIWEKLIPSKDYNAEELLKLFMKVSLIDLEELSLKDKRNKFNYIKISIFKIKYFMNCN